VHQLTEITLSQQIKFFIKVVISSYIKKINALLVSKYMYFWTYQMGSVSLLKPREPEIKIYYLIITSTSSKWYWTQYHSEETLKATHGVYLVFV